jgi:hypothetical protein
LTKTSPSSGEPSKRLGDEHDVLAVADGIEHQLGVLGESRALVVSRQVDRDRLVAGARQPFGDQVPVPRDTAGTGDQGEGGHVGLLPGDCGAGLREPGWGWGRGSGCFDDACRTIFG